ncbi:MAG: dihydrofolate reductase family protein [Planctomycetes bacterium]|jgi:dihydrofolate reductase|nr:dihydrofolate reductase family protein [Planctomycetota bacterium]
MIPVTLIMAITADGKIAKDSGHLADWTSREDKKHFVEITKEFGVIMMGENTFKTFPAPLKNRLNVVFSLNENQPEIEGVKWVKGEPEEVLKELEKMGYKKVLLGGGSFLNTLFMQKKLVSELILTVEPKIFGAGLSLFNQDLDADLKLLELNKINDDAFVMKYKVDYK